MTHVSVVQHTQSEWLGHIEDHLEGRGIRFGYHRPFAAGGVLPNPMTVGDGLILVGGGQWGAVPGRWQLPWLEAEVKLARACLMMDKPVIGIGVGAQVLSIAADGGVEPGALMSEVANAHRTRADALGGLMPERFVIATYMRDRPVPPGYADVLARDDAGRAAVFTVGPRSFGFIAHPGLRRAMIEDLVMESEDVPADTGKVLDDIGQQGGAIEDALVPLMAGLVAATGWMT
ncbi:MAG: hypothetical protein KGP27_06710 [Hyphomicrobiales bacterium]|nr:hypothetical protein [Hyphomicrobiales bacterium]